MPPSQAACDGAGVAPAAGARPLGPRGPPGSALPVWERLFIPGGLTRYLSCSEACGCRIACRDWRTMACDSATPEELWSHELGSARRSVAWKQLLLGGITLRQHAGTPQDSYEKLCETSSPYDSAIKRDVNRTLPQEDLFREKDGKGQFALFRLLRALAIRLWDIGYCQSLNFIVATLIGVFPDDEATAFHCALALLLRHSLVDLYRPKFPKLGVVVWQFDRIVEGFLPKVHAALVRHGVNSEYYAIQWFLTLFASDLQQATVRRIWDRFLVAGWRVLVQVGLALLYTIQDILPAQDTCHALSFLKKFARTSKYDAEELLASAASFKVSHRMLSALEAAYNWEDDVQLLVVKDLDNGQVHWAVQAVPSPPPSAPPRGEGDDEEGPPMVIPRAFSRGSESNGAPLPPGITPLDVGVDGDAVGGADRPQGTVLPFLLHNLDTGETSVIENAWSQYTFDMDQRARAHSGPLSVGPRTPAEATSPSPAPAQCEPNRAEQISGSFWMQSVQQQAVRRLSQS